MQGQVKAAKSIVVGGAGECCYFLGFGHGKGISFQS
jgi:hypothetical protein